MYKVSSSKSLYLVSKKTKFRYIYTLKIVRIIIFLLTLKYNKFEAKYLHIGVVLEVHK